MHFGCYFNKIFMMTKKKRQRWLYWTGGILLFLLLVHISLPFILVKYVNKSLRSIPDYTGSVNWIHVNLFRGAYVIHDLNILKEAGNIKDPFVSSPRIDLSLEWKALLNGKVVGEIAFTNPTLTFVVPTELDSGKQTGENVDWTKPLNDLMPLTINRLEIIQGTIHYKDPSSDPKVNISLNDLNATVTNLSNAANKSAELPSNFDLSAVSIGGGELAASGELDIVKQLPDFDINLSLEGVDLTALNDFAKAYAKADIEKGTLNFYTEFKGKDGKLEGYVKPLFMNMKFVDWGKEEKNPFEFAWEFIVGAVAEIFENQKKDQFGTRIPIQGNYEDIEAGIFTAIGNVLRNAFIQAFKGKTEGTVNFNENGNTNSKNGTETEDEDDSE